MKLKQLIITVLCLCSLLTLAACGKTEPNTTSAPLPSANTDTPENNIPPFLEDDFDDPDFPYVCNHTNNLYHLTSCLDVPTQESKIFTYYKTEEDAKKNGYTPCEKCLP